MSYTIFIGTYDGTLYLLELTHTIRVVRKIICPGSIRTVTFHGGVVYAAGYQGIIKVVDINKKLDLGEIQASKACINCMVVCPDSGLLAVAGQEGVLQFYNGLELVKSIAAHNKDINHIAVQGQLLVTSGGDKKIKFWSTKSLTHLRTVKLQMQPLQAFIEPGLKNVRILGSKGLYSLQTEDQTIEMLTEGRFQAMHQSSLLSGIDGSLSINGKQVDTGIGARIRALAMIDSLVLCGGVNGKIVVLQNQQIKVVSQLPQYIVTMLVIENQKEQVPAPVARIKKIKKK